MTRPVVHIKNGQHSMSLCGTIRTLLPGQYAPELKATCRLCLRKVIRDSDRTLERGEKKLIAHGFGERTCARMNPPTVCRFVSRSSDGTPCCAAFGRPGHGVVLQRQSNGWLMRLPECLNQMRWPEQAT